MKGFQKGCNFNTSANGQFRAEPVKLATGGLAGLKASSPKPSPRGIAGAIASKLGSSMKPAAPKSGMLGKIGSSLKSAVQKVAPPSAPVTPAAAPARVSPRPAPRAFKEGGAVMAGQGSGVHRAQIQEHGYAEGGKVETKEQFKVKLMKKQDPPAPKQKLARAADRQDFADLNGGDAQRETIRVGNTKASYKQAKDFQAEARIDEGKGGIETWNQRQGKVENYAKGGSVAGCHTIVERQMKKHVATPAPKGHKGLKA